MKESNLWNNLRKKLSEVLWQRIETGGTGRGIADVFGVYSSNCCWVELKVTNTNAVKLRPEQIAWLIKFGEAGVPTYILVGTDKRKLHLFSGLDAREVRDQGLKYRSLLELSAPYDWIALRNILFSK
tara:strand:+ start:226 stop:606 length:381 start_codon:yes stop_codon:yes gene_type:complete